MHIKEKFVSLDNTQKYIFALDLDNSLLVEGCLLNLKKHGPVICISSQVGCSQKCCFCAAGNLPFVRDLSSDEIMEQIALIIKDQPDYFTCDFQTTYMGSGEPFSNIENVIESSALLIKKYPNLKKINISTILPNLDTDINKFIIFKNLMHFQFSMHFTDHNTRNRYLGRQLPAIEDSLDYLDGLASVVDDIYSINYVLIEGENDSVIHAERLIDFANKHPRSYIKISELCPVNGLKYLPSTNTISFIEKISSSNTAYEQFSSMGTDVNAGCGQFYNESLI